MKQLTIIRWLLSFIGKAWLKIVILFWGIMLTSFFAIYFSVPYQQIFDALAIMDIATFQRSFLIFIVMRIAYFILNCITDYYRSYLNVYLSNQLKQKVVTSIFSKRLEETLSLHSAQLGNRLDTDVNSIVSYIVNNLSNLVTSGTRIVFSIIYLSIIDFRFLWFLPISGITLLVSLYLRKTSKSLQYEERETIGDIRIFYQDYLSQLMLIRSFSVETQVKRYFKEILNHYKEVTLKLTRVSLIIRVSMQFSMLLITISCLTLGARNVFSGTMTIGTLMAVVRLSREVLSNISSASSVPNGYFALITSCERLYELDSWENSLSEDRLEHEELMNFYDHHFQSLRLEEVSFTYNGEDKEVISQLNLSLNKGDFLAIIGPSGVGKSTLAKLIMGIYQPKKGNISLSYDKKEKTPLTSKYYGLFAYVPQGNNLMSGTIRELVSFKPAKTDLGEIDDDRVWQALDLACAKEFVEKLEKGLDTRLGERGFGLSEGQIQRLAIARALYVDHPILILDEASSSLDQETETELLHKLKKMTDKTLIIITHRPSLLNICNKKVVFSAEAQPSLVEY